MESQIDKEIDANIRDNIETNNQEIDKLEDIQAIENKEDFLLPEKESDNEDQKIEVKDDELQDDKNNQLMDQEEELEKEESQEQNKASDEAWNNLQLLAKSMKGKEGTSEKIVEDTKADQNEEELPEDQNSNNPYQIDGEEEQIDNEEYRPEEEEQEEGQEEGHEEGEEEVEENEPEPPISWVKSSILKLDELKEYLCSSTLINFRDAVADPSLTKKCKNYIMGIKDSPVKSVEILTDIHSRPQNTGYLSNQGNPKLNENQYNNKIIERYLSKAHQNDSNLYPKPELFSKDKYQLLSDYDKLKGIYSHDYSKASNSLNPYSYSRKI